MDLGAGPRLLEFQGRGLIPQVSHKGRQAVGTPVGPCPWVLGSSMLSLSRGRSPNRLSWERCTEVQAPSALTTRQPAKWGSRSCVHSTHAHGGSVPLAEGVSSRSPGPGGASFIPFLRGTEAAPPQVTGSRRTVPGGGMTFWTACGPQTGIRALAQPPSRSASGLGPGGATGPNWLGVIPGCQCLLSPTGRQPGLGTGHQWALGWTASLWCAGREGGEDRYSGGSERRLAEGSGRGQPRGGLGGHAVTGSLGDARLWELLLQMLVPPRCPWEVGQVCARLVPQRSPWQALKEAKQCLGMGCRPRQLLCACGEGTPLSSDKAQVTVASTACSPVFLA